MKILVFADPHGSLSALEKVHKLAKKEKVKYILCVGDITIFEQGLEKIVEKMDKWDVPVLLIHGNHENKGVLEYVCNKTKNIKFVHKQLIRDGDIAFLNYGGGGFAMYDPKFEETAEGWKEELKKGDKIVLQTHQPPYAAVDEVLENEHAGSKSIARFIKQVKPLFAFCGHLHENFGREDKIKKTRVINPGPYGMVFEI